MPRTKTTWQQATALVSLSTCGAMTGFAFAHGTVDELTSPTRMPVKLMALNKPAELAKAEHTGDGALRSAIVKVAKNYLRMAQSRSPAEMEALIWGVDSVDGADHGESCAAFASLTLAMGAQATGQQSWVTGGRRIRGRCASGPTYASTPIRAPRRSSRSCRMPRPITAGTRWATATGRSPETGCCSTAMSKWSPTSRPQRSARSEGIPCRTFPLTRTHSPARWPRRA